MAARAFNDCDPEYETAGNHQSTTQAQDWTLAIAEQGDAMSVFEAREG
ncbi:MAG TPA: hypothetical protein VH640_14285 [Bryobacteraceae bacterium]|jgi:hypothetical protein